jgi:hypothetical protein
MKERGTEKGQRYTVENKGRTQKDRWNNETERQQS